MKRFLPSILLLTGLVAATACKKDDVAPAAPAPLMISGTLNGSQEVPANASTATGTLSGTFDKTSKVLTYTVTFKGLSPTSGHFHLGAPGTKGDVFIPFPKNNATNDGYVSPITGTITLNDPTTGPAQAAAVTSGAFYANLHTVAYSGGEIRADATVK